MLKIYRYQFVFLALFAFFLLGCESKKETKFVSVAMNTWPGYEPIYLAKELGFLDDNIKINRVESATDTVAMFHNDIIDIAFVTLDEAITLRDRVDYDIKIITIMDSSNGGDVILGQEDIKSLKDLKGKKIGVEASGVGAYILLRAFELDSDIEIEDVTVVSTIYNEHEESFKNKNVAAVVTFEPVKTILLKESANILFDSSKIPNEILDVMIVKDKSIDKKYNELRNFLIGWYKAVDFIKLNHKKSMKMMAKYEGVKYLEFEKAFSDIMVPSLKENRLSLAVNNTQTQDLLEGVGDFLLSNKMISKKVKVKDVFTNKLLPK